MDELSEQRDMTGFCPAERISLQIAREHNSRRKRRCNYNDSPSGSSSREAKEEREEEGTAMDTSV